MPEPEPDPESEPVTMLTRHLRLPYNLSAGAMQARFTKAVREEKKIYGNRCTQCKRVLIPPDIACAVCWADTEGWIALGDHGVIKSFTVMRIPFRGQQIEIPYVIAQIVPDGADLALMHLLQEIEAEDVRIGMRVEAVWTEEERRGSLADDILYFRPTGEPDMPIEELVERGWGL